MIILVKLFDKKQSFKKINLTFSIIFLAVVKLTDKVFHQSVIVGYSTDKLDCNYQQCHRLCAHSSNLQQLHACYNSSM